MSQRTVVLSRYLSDVERRISMIGDDLVAAAKHLAEVSTDPLAEPLPLETAQRPHFLATRALASACDERADLLRKLQEAYKEA